MDEYFDSAYSFAHLDSVDGAVEDIQALEKKLSEAYGTPVTLIAFTSENNTAANA
ncbi:hypothetical protein [Paenibacillus kobensis]|uniref:hypothetical protein n=1 Tax=Paenibacillus kobensis TaxID=59841 RepID=UPI0013E3B6BC|nr:hypothetical protein [Paenibacillus kobensis]